MPDFLKLTIDKFTFKVAIDRYYTAEGIWAKVEGNRVRVGVSDYLQQRNGDVAFAEVTPLGAKLQSGDELASIETIKVNLSLASPVSGTIVEVNPVLSNAPETFNQDPYGTGWLVVIEATNWDAERTALLDPTAYFAYMKADVDREAKKE